MTSALAAELRGATVRLGGRTVWSHVDVAVEHGDFVAVLGPNGVGKSTVLKVLLGIYALAEGTCEVLGAPPGDAAGEIGYVPQRRSFDAALRLRGSDIVRLGLDGDRWGMPLPIPQRWSSRRRAAERQVADVIERVDATSYAERPIGELSGGEQQRLLIAQALVRRPRLLLLDEPLDSLDLPNQASVAALVAEICHDQEVTVLLVAHDINPIFPYVDRVIYLGEGRAAIGPPSEVITTETLSRLYRTPIEVLTASDGRLVVVGQPEPPAHHTDRHAH